MKSKKIVSLALSVLLIASVLTISISAGDGEDYGTLPKTNQAIAIDGVKDDVYNLGLTKNLDRYASIAWGEITYLWTDGFLYVFADVHDEELFEPEPAVQAETPWTTDSVEVFIDPENDGDAAIQYRIDISDWACWYLQDDVAHAYGPDAESKLEHARVRRDDGYTVEFKIPITNVEGSQIGLQATINDVNSSGQNTIYIENNVVEAGAWNPEYYGFATLGGLIDPPLASEEVAPTVDEVTPTANNDAKPVVIAPKTSDSAVILLFVLALIAGAAIFAVRAKKTNS
ncbi:hypothetical protein FACS1894219_11960 [Clostridia bacterium]|nr:hypothetical protein FACS1894219_11960 [Clostridia bacterium]